MAMAMVTIARCVSRVGIAATGATVLRAVSVEIAAIVVTVRRVASAPIVTSA